MSKLSLSLFLSYFRLLRLSNAPTAIADVAMGIVVATGSLLPVDRTLLLIFASLSLYHGGMVLNDAADVEQDLRERPNRPLPAGEIRMPTARALGQFLLVLGIGFCFILGWISQQWWPTVVASLLAITIIFYNSPLKKTKWGPWLMGICRGLNGMLGLVLAGSWELLLLITPGVIAYVAGLTLFARDEAGVSSRNQMLLGAAISIGGMLWLGIAPYLLFEVAENYAFTLQNTQVWIMLWLIIILMVGRYYLGAIWHPSANRIQHAVVRAIQGLIVINAALVFCYVGVFYGLAILALLPISKLLTLVIPAT